MTTFAQAGRRTTEEWRKLGFKPLKGEIGLKRHDKEWFTPNQVISLTRPHTHPKEKQPS